MRLGTVVTKKRGGVYIEPDCDEDDIVNVCATAPDVLGMRTGIKVLYQCDDRDTMATIVREWNEDDQCSPNEWNAGWVQAIKDGYLFIRPDHGGPNVFCLRSAFVRFNSAIGGDMVSYRAGLSEKNTSPHLQAIRVLPLPQSETGDTERNDYEDSHDAMSDEGVAAASSSGRMGVATMMPREGSVNPKVPWRKSRKLAKGDTATTRSGTEEGYGRDEEHEMAGDEDFDNGEGSVGDVLSHCATEENVPMEAGKLLTDNFYVRDSSVRLCYKVIKRVTIIDGKPSGPVTGRVTVEMDRLLLEGTDWWEEPMTWCMDVSDMPKLCPETADRLNAELKHLQAEWRPTLVSDQQTKLASSPLE